MVDVRLHGVRRVHPDGTVALAGVDLDIADGELVGLLGPSGSGKSTLIRVIAGLEPLTDGIVRIGGRDRAVVPARERGVAIAVDHRSLDAVLDHLEQAGGRASRDARPSTRRTPVDVLLADDPVRGLDPGSQRRGLDRLRAAVRPGHATLLTSNEHPNVLRIADRVAVVRAGRIVQVDTAADLLARPHDRFVAGFVGPDPMTFVAAVPEEGGGLPWLHIGPQRLRMPGGMPGPLRARTGTTVLLGARPGTPVATEPGDRADLRLDARASTVVHLGHVDHVGLALPGVEEGGRPWVARFPPAQRVQVGDRIEVTVDARRVSAFDPDTGRAIWHGDGG